MTASLPKGMRSGLFAITARMRGGQAGEEHCGACEIDRRLGLMVAAVVGRRRLRRASVMTQAARVDHDGGAEPFDGRDVRKPGGHQR
jgi:hypothetical protein